MQELSDNKPEKSTEVATAEDFRRLAFMRADEEFCAPERIVLPASGLPIMIRRPKAGYFALRGLPVPQSIAARSAAAPDRAWTDEEAREMAAKIVDLFSRAFVSPRLSLSPGPDEINPNWLLPDDVNFLFRLLAGEVLPGGRDLAQFRREDGSSAAPGEDRGTVALPAE